MTLLQQAEQDCQLRADTMIDQFLSGSRCVRYAVCCSFVLGSLSGMTAMRLCRSPNRQYLAAIPPTLFSAIFGWWALPWGPLLTLRALWINLQGGEDLTEQIFRDFQLAQQENPE